MRNILQKKMLFMRNVFLQTYVLRTLPSSIHLPILPHYTKNHDPIAEVVIFVDVDQNRPVLSVCNI